VLPLLALVVMAGSGAALRKVTPLGRIGFSLLAVLPFLAIPLVVVGIGSLWIPNCDPLQGLVHYLAGPVVGTVFGASVGLVVSRGSNRFSTLLGLAIWLLLVVINLQHFYRHPPIAAFNHFVGYFNGAIYDDLIDISQLWATFRLITVALATALFGLTLLKTSGSRILIGALVLVTVASVLPPFNLTDDAIADELGGRHETEHFVIHYPIGGTIEANITALAADHEFRYAQLSELLGVEPPEKVTSFIYGDAEQKQRLMGAGRTYIAKPWAGSIHLNSIDVGASVLKHELAHVFGASIADGWLGIPTSYGLFPNMAVVEGFAVAATWDSGRLTPHQWSAAMRKLGIAPTIENLLGNTGFLGVQSGQAYTVSGSFLRYLLETHGLEKFSEYYRTGDIEHAYKKPLKALESHWAMMLDDSALVTLTETDQQLARDHFDAPSRFHRVCALEVARWERDADDATDDGRHDEAIKLHEKIVGFDEDPERRWNLLEALVGGSRLAEATELAETLANDERASVVLRTRARIRGADVLWLRGDRVGAHSLYQQLSKRPQNPSSERRVLISAIASGWTDGSTGDIVRDYLVGEGPRDESTAALMAATKRHPEVPTLAYLAGRRMMIDDDLAAADRAFTHALAANISPVSLARESHRLRGDIAFRQGRFSDAIGHFGEARERFSARGYRLRMTDWIARCQFNLAALPTEQ
jgi:tetratricopeptide (TPR) repeat protein